MNPTSTICLILGLPALMLAYILCYHVWLRRGPRGGTYGSLYRAWRHLQWELKVRNLEQEQRGLMEQMTASTAWENPAQALADVNQELTLTRAKEPALFPGDLDAGDCIS